MYLMHILHDTLIKHGFLLKGYISYMLWVLIYVIGGEGDDISAHLNVWASSLGLGLLCWFGSFAAWLRDLFV